MKKIYYNIEQLTNALATGLLGLATLGPMTSCEKNEPDNFNQKETVIDKGEVSGNGVLYCGLEDFDGEVGPNYTNIGHYDDDAYIIIELDNNNGVTTLMLDLYTPNDVNYCITFEDNGNNNFAYMKMEYCEYGDLPGLLRGLPADDCRYADSG